jgi:hypothetical protein
MAKPTHIAYSVLQSATSRSEVDPENTTMNHISLVRYALLRERVTPKDRATMDSIAENLLPLAVKALNGDVGDEPIRVFEQFNFRTHHDDNFFSDLWSILSDNAREHAAKRSVISALTATP